MTVGDFIVIVLLIVILSLCLIPVIMILRDIIRHKKLKKWDNEIGCLLDIYDKGLLFDLSETNSILMHVICKKSHDQDFMNEECAKDFAYVSYKAKSDPIELVKIKRRVL